MELNEAVLLAKTLSEQFAGLAKVGEAIKLLEGGDRKMASLMAQKESLEQIIVTRREELLSMDAQMTQALDQKKAAHKTALAALDADLVASQSALTTVQRDHAAMIERGRNAQREITAGMLEERRISVDALDKEIATKQKQVTTLRDELTKLRERVGA